MVYRLARAAGADVTPEMATCLYTTVLTDTGGFCYGTVHASTFALARELVQAGADPDRHRPGCLLLRARLQAAAAGRGAAQAEARRAPGLAVGDAQDMIRTCATEEDCEGIVNFALGVAGVEAAVFLRELPEGRVRLSLRSKGKVNVAAIAARLGGGGHENAAGCTLDGPLERALDQILRVFRDAVAPGGGNRA